jgi:hypothetical protein
VALSSFSTSGEIRNPVCSKTRRKKWRMFKYVLMFSSKAKKGTFLSSFLIIPSILTDTNIGGICPGVYSECDYNPPTSIGCITFFSSDLLKEISSLNEQPGPTADQTMYDPSSMKSGNESRPVSNSAYPAITPRSINLPNSATMPPAPIGKPIGATTRNDWGLNDLLPSQTGIVHANPAVVLTSNYDVGGWYNDVPSQGWAPPSTRGVEYEMMASDELMDDTPFMYPNGMVNAEMLSLWAEASATFR